MAASVSAAILRNELPLKGVRRIANSAIDRALHVIGEPTADTDEDIHVIRATTKHLRALLRLVRPLLPDETFKTEDEHLRKAARMLAGLRDAVVALQTLSVLGEHVQTKISRIAIEEATVILRRHLPRGHSAPASVLRRVSAALEAARPRFKSSTERSVQWRGVIEGYRAVYRASRSRFKRASQKGDAVSFHRWRIRVKNLYFQTLYLTPIWPKRLESMAADLQKLQSHLGDLHDLAVLRALLTKYLESSEAIGVVMDAIEERRLKLQKRACKLGRKLFRKKPAKIAARLATRVNALLER